MKFLKILIVEDDEDISFIEEDFLKMRGFETKVIKEGLEALKEIKNNIYDLIILDVMLPGIDGIEILSKIRNELDIPILIVSAKGELVNKLKGLGLGADDYITKPFDPNELVARVESNLKTYSRLKGNQNEINIKGLKIIKESYQVLKNGKEIKLPNKEFELLLYLVNNINIVCSRENLFENIWGMDSDADDITVAVHINRLRDKIEDDPSNPKIIETVWGVGYKISKQ